jgi:DNA-binding MurR/RpiR family transcriptional regulator
MKIFAKMRGIVYYFSVPMVQIESVKNDRWLPMVKTLLRAVISSEDEMDTEIQEIGEEKNDKESIDTIYEIRHKFASLSKTNKKIADFLLTNPEKLSSYSISLLARKLQTSPSSITRFCQAIGFTGFPDLKYSILRNQSPFQNQEIDIYPNESVTDIKRSINALYGSLLNDTLMSMDEGAIKRATRRLSTCKKIVIFSQGGPLMAANYAQTSFMQLGRECVVYNDATISMLAAYKLEPDDVAIGISYSGTAKIPVDALRIAHERNICTIGISGFENSFLIKYSDIKFCYNCRINDDMRYMHIARICEITIIGVLHACLLAHNYERIHKTMENAKAATLLGRYE